jgi:adenosylcobinamide-phosphate synthase
VLLRRARPPFVRTLLWAATTWSVVGGTSLGREAMGISAALADDDLPGARRRLPALVGRDPSELSAAEVARAVVESVAENTSDAAVAPLLWGAAFGLPGLLGYRAVNTLDAMVGYRSTRYSRFGWASARLDDVANLVPARLTGWLAVLLAWSVGGSPAAAAAVLRRDGSRHPSPNSGHCEAAFAGALGVTLGGRNDYAGRVEERPLLGDGLAAGAMDIERAVRLSALVSRTAGLLAVVVLVLRGSRQGSSS